jgi:pyridoxamine 5'-phosphate oxidase
MSMTKAEVLTFINANTLAAIATVEGNKPHVRRMRIYKADERGIIFQTWKAKDTHKQLAKNPETELCFNTESLQVRISGRMELAEDIALKKEIEAAKPFLSPIIKQVGGYDALAIWVLKKGKITWWTMADNFAPKTYIDF